MLSSATSPSFRASPRPQAVYHSQQPFNTRHSPSPSTQPPQRSPRGWHAQAVPAPPAPPQSTTDEYSTAQQPKGVDAGTQYSPPDWPPTDPRSSRYPKSANAIIPADRPQQQEPLANNPDSPATGANSATAHPAEPPVEPQLRITPQSSLQNVSRRPRGDGVNTEGEHGAKRHKTTPTGAVAKVVPRDYSTCEPKLLASVIASLLMRLIHHNDQIPLKDGQLTRFHSRAPPGISVNDYLQRLTFHATLSPPILLSMVFFIDRLSQNFSTFIINSLTVHRFLITAATVASKGLSDSFWTNATYARVGGVSVKELALLELELLMKCDWRIVPKPEDLVDYYKGLVEQSDDFAFDVEAMDMTADES